MSASEPARVLTADETAGALRDRTAAVDDIVLRAATESLAPELGDRFAVAAVGGYGRKELFPYSDVDILVLLREDVGQPVARAPVGRFVQSLWDERLRLSQSVHTVSECCELYEQNVELSISLLDRRHLCGDAGLYDELEHALPKFYRVQHDSIARNLARLTRARHAKFQGSIYHLEPNVKEGPGGLRDIHVLHWLARLRGVPEHDEQLSEARAFLLPARFFLHMQAGRDQNVLTFDAQEAMSDRPEDMMRRHFRHAREVHRLALEALSSVEERDRTLLAQFRDWRSRVSNADFTIRRERVYVREPGQLEVDPLLLFRLFEFVGHHGIPLSADAERRVQQALRTLAPRLANETRWGHLRSILIQRYAGLALRALCDSGAWQAILPEWRRIDCLVVRDFYHRYTVDEHTLVAIEHLEHIDDSRFHELMSEIDDRALLKLAILVHDIGKGAGHHVEASARIAGEVAARLGMRGDERNTLVFLVEKHLELSAAMTRDLEDAATQRVLADSVGSVERLKMLTMLTWADISAVNPTAMTPWRREQLWRAYVVAYAELTRELDSDRVHDARATLGPDLAGFVEGLPRRYVRMHGEAEIRKHFELAQSAQGGAAALVERRNGFNQLVVAAPDRPFLFATLCGVLASFGMNILKAEAFSNAAGTALDTFVFSDPNRTLELNPSEIERLESTVRRAVAGRVDVDRLIANRRHTARPRGIDPQIAFSNDASQHATLVEIVAADRPGLLYALASAISSAGCNIVLVLIDTEADKALDVFYVTVDGAKLDTDAQSALEGLLVAACNM